MPVKSIKMKENVPPEIKPAVQNMVSKIEDHIKNNGSPYDWTINDFQIGMPLGRGKFGRVYLAREKTTKYMVALKMLFKGELIKEHMEHQIIREIEINTHLQHPHLLSLLTYFHDSKRIFLVLEYAAGGELYRYLQSQPEKRFSEKVAAKFIDQVADAIYYCHQNNVIHRDIKPENILLTIDGNIKLADFGWSVHAPRNIRNTMCGTLDYLPPEMVEKKSYKETVDHWCIGILCYEFLVGKPPFESKDQATTFKRIKMVDVKYPTQISAKAKNLISKLLKYIPEARLSLPEVRKHPWILQHIDSK